MATEFTHRADPRFGAEPIGMRNGTNSYRLTYFGKPFEPDWVVAASRVVNELDRAVRQMSTLDSMRVNA